MRTRPGALLALALVAACASTTGCRTSCWTSSASIDSSAQGAATAQEAREEWSAQDRAARGGAPAEHVRLEVTELPGHGWFVTGATTCR